MIELISKSDALTALFSSVLLGGWLLIQRRDIARSIMSRPALRCQIVGLKFQKALLKCRQSLLQGRIRFLETHNLNLIWCHWLSIVTEELCSLYAHIFKCVNPPNEKS